MLPDQMTAFGRLLPIATGSNGAVSASASLPPAVQVECKRVVSINAIAWSDECNFADVEQAACNEHDQTTSRPTDENLEHEADLHLSGQPEADLKRYAALHSQTYGEEVDALTLVPYMLEAFMVRDRVFRRLGKTS